MLGSSNLSDYGKSVVFRDARVRKIKLISDSMFSKIQSREVIHIGFVLEANVAITDNNDKSAFEGRLK